MKFVNERVQAVVLILCDEHAPQLEEKVQSCPEGNWFVLPSAETARIGYWQNVSQSHPGHGHAILGFAESGALERMLHQFATINEDGSLCPDCVAYKWDVIPSHIADTTTDPVCGRTINCSDASAHRHKGELFFFCSFGCRDEFLKDPEKYVRNDSTRSINQQAM